MSGAEWARKHRQKRDADPNKRMEYLAKEKIRSKERSTSVQDMSDRGKRRQRRA